MFGWLTGKGRNRQRRRTVEAFQLGGLGRRVVRARFDAAQTTPDNRRHWANADGLSADAAANPADRRTLRNRGRYEVANNCYARGMVLTLANDVIGPGPRLQMLTDNPKLDEAIEREFSAWAKLIDLPGKLRTMRQARAQDGEAFAVLFTNEALDHPVKLDLRLIEADQVATPGLPAGEPNAVDGIEFDQFGNPSRYHVLKAHPGAGGFSAGALSQTPEPIDARWMIHWFRQDRPGQRRGLPDIMPALPLYGELRQYRQAVLGSARAAANISLLMKTNAPADGEAADVEPMTEMEFSPNMAIFAPEGWEPFQIKPEQPTVTFNEYCGGVVGEQGRCVNMPKNVALCDSSDYNYASGRLDHQTYFKSIRVEHQHLETQVLDRVLIAWLQEAVLVLAELASLAQPSRAPHQWFWEGREHVDPLKEANAQAVHLANYTTSLAIEYAKQGRDWEEALRQIEKEKNVLVQLGFTWPTRQGGGGQSAEASGDEDDVADAARREVRLALHK